MGFTNQKGQVFIEVSLVLLLVITIFFGALTKLSQVQSKNRHYQFTKEDHLGKDSQSQVRK